MPTSTTAFDRFDWIQEMVGSAAVQCKYLWGEERLCQESVGIDLQLHENS